jgi:hypothetical protein
VYYNELYKLGGCAEMAGECTDMLAATDGKTGAVLIANPDAAEREIELTLSGLSGKITMHQTAADCTQSTTALGNTTHITVPAQTAVLLTIA